MINAYIPPNPLKQNVLVGGKQMKKIDEKSTDGNGIIQADPLKKIYLTNQNKNLTDLEHPIKLVSNSNVNSSIDKNLQSTKNSKKIEINHKDIYTDNFTEISNNNSNPMFDVVSLNERKEVFNILDKIEDKSKITEKVNHKVFKRESAQLLPTHTDESLKVFPKNEEHKHDVNNKKEPKEEETNPSEISMKKDLEPKRTKDRELEESNEIVTKNKEAPITLTNMKSNLIGESPRFVKRPSSKREIIDAKQKVVKVC